MQAKKNEKLYMITLDLTYKCNFRCLHCFNNSGEQDLGLKELSDEEIMSVVEDIIKLQPTAICLCGGETLLREKLIYKVTNAISKGTNGKTQINMVTNGFLMTRETAINLKKAGMTNVQISLDGLEKTHEWLRNKEGAFEHAINGLKYLKEAGLMVSVSMCPTKRNYNEAVEVMKLCDSLGVDNFRCQPLMLLGRAKENLKNECLNDDEYRNLVMSLEECNCCECSSNMIFEWGDPVEHLQDYKSNTLVNNSSLQIDAYGYIVASPYIPLYLGNVRRHRLLDYWNNGYYNHINKNLVREMFGLVIDAKNMDIHDVNDKCPKNHYEKSLYIDWIDDNDKYNCSIEEL